MRIALLEDDRDQAEMLQAWIHEADHDCYAFATGESFQQALRNETFDVLIVDWNLPDTTGPEVLDWVRQNVDWHIPVIFITSRDGEDDIVQALGRGADDYMVKPVRRHETLARLHALDRRSAPDMDMEMFYEYAPYRVEMKERRIMLEGEPVTLRNMEFELAVLLFRNAGRLLSRSYILENVWGTRGDINTRTVDTHVSRLRNKLNITPERGWKLSAVYHHGYRLEKLSEQAG
jgi:DNA-binding response OmpR family regulator